jgi:hypothetical protein
MMRTIWCGRPPQGASSGVRLVFEHPYDVPVRLGYDPETAIVMLVCSECGQPLIQLATAPTSGTDVNPQPCGRPTIH